MTLLISSLLRTWPLIRKCGCRELGCRLVDSRTSLFSIDLQYYQLFRLLQLFYYLIDVIVFFPSMLFRAEFLLETCFLPSQNRGKVCKFIRLLRLRLWDYIKFIICCSWYNLFVLIHIINYKSKSTITTQWPTKSYPNMPNTILILTWYLNLLYWTHYIFKIIYLNLIFIKNLKISA